MAATEVAATGAAAGRPRATAASRGVEPVIFVLSIASALVVLGADLAHRRHLAARPAGDEHELRRAVVDDADEPLLVVVRRHGARLGLGLAIATVLAVPIGILLGSSDLAASAFRIPIEFLRPIPSAALIPVLFLTLGTNLKSEVFLAAFGAFWPLLVQTIYGVRDVDPVALETARSFGVGRFERLYRITLPSAVPYIATGLRIASTVSLILAFTAELFMGTQGLGQDVNYAQSYGLDVQLYALALATGFLGVAIHLVFIDARAPRAALASVATGGGRREPRRRAAKIAAEIAVPIAILAAWQAWTVHARLVEVPAPLDDPRRVPATCGSSRSSASTSCRASSASASASPIAAVVGIALGIPIGLSRWARLWTMPHIEYWRAMPPPALLPISIVLLHSIGNRQKVAFIAFFCLFPILLNTIDGVRGDRPDAARDRALVQHPAARADPPARAAGGARRRSPRACERAVSLAVIMMVLSEYFSSTSGVGYVLLISKNTFQFTPMWAAIVLIGVLGYVLNVVFLLAERRLLAWHRGWRAAAGS